MDNLSGYPHRLDNPTGCPHSPQHYDYYYLIQERTSSKLLSLFYDSVADFLGNDLREFVEILKKITIDSIYFHMFEARLRLERKSNDFSLWIESSIGDKDLADKILKLDPYTFTLEDLRKTLIQMVNKKIGKNHGQA